MSREIQLQKIRLKIFSFGFILAAFALLFKLFSWQVLKAGELSSQAKLQHEQGGRVTAQRGNILAADGSWLAASIEGWLVYAEKPKLEENARALANKLAPLFIEEEEDLLAEAIRLEELLTKKGVVWVPLKNKVDADLKNNLEALEIAGIGFQEESLRYYPESSSSAHVLGFVGKDEEGSDRGYFGLEGFYDLVLSGKPGFIRRESNAFGVPLFGGGDKEISARQGVDLVLHLDKAIQRVVEAKLKDAIELYGAKSGTVIVMDPENGAVLAMASSPSYDPKSYSNYSDEYFKNPAISDAFEPGSVFKPLVMAAALDAKEVKPDTKCDICEGPVKVDKYEIETWNKEYRPDSTMTDVIIHSDNVGMVFVGQKLGPDKLYNYLENYGFGQPTQIDLQGEASPALREKGTWNVVDLATASFGQGVAVTPLQMIRAAAVLANKGNLVTPQVVDKVQAEGWEEDIKPVVREDVISKKAAAEITEMMVQAVKEGESKWVQAKGFRVAGKTGTAQIPVAGHYDEEKTIASFVGFAPAEDAKFIMLVTLREPESSPWASETAAPLWFSIAGELFPYLGIQPEN